MPNQPLNLNIARIVHRLITYPRGWRVSQLQQELGIAPRTYRKYRQLLQEDFRPFLRRDGTSMVVEVEDGDERYLRLRPPREIGATDQILECYTAAVYFAHSMLAQTNQPKFQKAADALVADLKAAVRDRNFLFDGVFAHADRMFVAEGGTAPAADLGPLVHAVANQKKIELHANGKSATVCPLSLVLRPDGVTVIVMKDGEIERHRVQDVSVEVLSASFEYPSASRYSP